MLWCTEMVVGTNIRKNVMYIDGYFELRQKIKTMLFKIGFT